MSFLAQRFHVVHSAPVWMSMPERVLLYGLVAGLQPRRVLEIGTFRGGSTQIMCAALDDVGAGRILCVDPEPRIAPADWALIRHRATVVPEASPAAVATARELADGPFELALVDGDHSEQGVVSDIEATLPALADDAHLLFHDAHYFHVRNGIDRAIAQSGGRLRDAGMVSVEPTPDGPDADGNDVQWGGLRLLRFVRDPA